MEMDNLLEKINQMFGKNAAVFNILQEQVDIAVQMEYFEKAQELEKNLTNEEIIARREDIFNEEISIEERKGFLIQLAKTGDVLAYCTIEKLACLLDNPLTTWGKLALNDCRIRLESSLLDESQVYISTGLGGKGSKLRYFVVLQSEDSQIVEFQQKLIKNEFEFSLNKHKSEIEEISFEDNLAIMIVLVPMNESLRGMLLEALKECNSLGSNLLHDLIVTNVKTMTFDEVKKVLNRIDENENLELEEEHGDNEDDSWLS